MVHAHPERGGLRLTYLSLRFLLAVLLSPVAIAVGIDAVGAATGTAADVFSIGNVNVDQTAASASKARQTAIAEGQRRALDLLLRRLTLKSGYANLPNLSATQVAELVRSIQVEEEKTSPVRYLARLTVHFKPRAVRALLREEGIAFAETLSKPLLVLPIYQAAGAQSLWDDPNSWRESWAQIPQNQSLLEIIVPLGDLSDIADIGPAQAMSADKDRLDAISRRYGASGVLVTVATLTMDPVGRRPGLDVSVSRYGQAIQEYTTISSFTAQGNEDVDQLLRRAAAQVASQVEEAWKADNLMQFDRRPEALAVVVPIESMEDWLKIRRRLDQVPIVRKVETLSLARNEARIALHFLGGADQLKLALAQSDLTLYQGATSWVLSLSKAGG